MTLQPGFSFADHEVWRVFMTIALVLCALVISALIRNQSKFIRKTLLPVPVIAGFLLLIAGSIWKAIAGTDLFSRESMEVLTYHCLGLGFAATALQTSEKQKSKKAKKDIFNASLITASGYILQAVVGLIVSIALFYIIGSWAGSGVLLPMGYGQGPGQAFNWGNIYEQQYGFTYGASFGLAVAATGFISACVGGVIYLNKMRKNGSTKVKSELGAIVEGGELEYTADPKEIPLSDSVDKLTVQIGLVFISYLLTYGLISLISVLCVKSGVNILATTVNNLFWGFNFIWATLTSMLIRGLLVKGEQKGILKQKYINNQMLDRVSGLSFDVMVTAALGAINLSAFKHSEFVIPLVIMSVLGMICTYFFVKFSCKKLYPTYSDEMFLAMYGMLTGTASTGVILLREIDPHFKTAALKNLIFQALWTVLLGAPLLLLMGQVPQEGWLFKSLGIFAFMFVVFFVWILLAAKKLAKQQAAEAEIKE